MDLSIIIVNYNTEDLVKQCIKSVKKSEPSLNFEIIVIDNASKDDTVEMVPADFPDVKLIANKKNLGFSKAVNQGIRASRGRYILNLNPDIIVVDSAIDKLYEYMETHPKVGLVSAKLINPNGSVQESCFRFPTPKITLYRRTFLGKTRFAKKDLDRFLMRDFDHKTTRKVDWLLGACLFARKEAIKQVGLMDERFFMYFDDVDWSRRFWEKGWRAVYYPKAEMAHYHRRSSADKRGIFVIFDKIGRIHIASGIKYFWKYFGKQNPRKA